MAHARASRSVICYFYHIGLRGTNAGAGEGASLGAGTLLCQDHSGDAGVAPKGLDEVFLLVK